MATDGPGGAPIEDRVIYPPPGGGISRAGAEELVCERFAALVALPRKWPWAGDGAGDWQGHWLLRHVAAATRDARLVEWVAAREGRVAAAACAADPHAFVCAWDVAPDLVAAARGGDVRVSAEQAPRVLAAHIRRAAQQMAADAAASPFAEWAALLRGPWVRAADADDARRRAPAPPPLPAKSAHLTAAATERLLADPPEAHAPPCMRAIMGLFSARARGGRMHPQHWDRLTLTRYLLDLAVPVDAAAQQYARLFDGAAARGDAAVAREPRAREYTAEHVRQFPASAGPLRCSGVMRFATGVPGQATPCPYAGDGRAGAPDVEDCARQCANEFAARRGGARPSRNAQTGIFFPRQYAHASARHAAFHATAAH